MAGVDAARAHEQAFAAKHYAQMILSGKEATDDAALAEMLGIPVKLVDGDPANIKITTPEDIAVGERILKMKN